MPRLRRYLVLLAVALGLSAALVGLLAATEVSLRAIDHRESDTRSAKPEPRPRTRAARARIAIKGRRSE